MLIDNFGGNWKKVVNFVMVLILVVSTILGGIAGSVCGVIGSIAGMLVNFFATYLLEIIIFTPCLVIFNILINLDISLIRKNKKEE